MLRKILIVNKYHFISGGAERYFLAVMDALKARGIEPIPLSVNYEKTLPTPYRKYFIEPIAKNGEAKIQKMSLSFSEKARTAARVFYSMEAKKAVTRICEDHKPDAAYFLNFNNHISPSAIVACSELGIPVAMRLSDYNLSCSSNMYYRDGHACMDCKSGLHHAVIHGCVHGSRLRSLVQVAAQVLHRRMQVYQKVSAFIAPTEFMRKDLIGLGFPESQVHRVNTFKQPCGSDEPPDNTRPYMLYTGRFVPYKGVETALRAFASLKQNQVALKLVGDEEDAQAAHLKQLARQLGAGNIEFLPFERDASKLHELRHRAIAGLVPSECYDNLPNTLLETFACGRPVITSNLGSLPDIVEGGRLGLLFSPGNVQQLAEQMQWLIENPERRFRMGMEARKVLTNDYSETAHVDKLLHIFQSMLQSEKGEPQPDRLNA